MDLNGTAAGKADAKLSAVDPIESIPQFHQPLVALEIKIIPHGGLFIHLYLIVVSENPPDLLFEILPQVCQP